MKKFKDMLKNLNDNRLDKLELAEDSFNKNDFKKLLKALTKTTQLKFVILVNVKLHNKTDKHYIYIKSLLNALTKNIGLEELALKGLVLNDEMAKYLASILVAWPNLKKFNMADNLLTDVGAVPLIQALYQQKFLINAGFHSNQLGNHSAKACAELLTQQNILEELTLSNNQIKGDEISRLASAISTHPSLNSFFIANNQLNQEGGKILYDALKDNMTLIKLDIYQNNIGSSQEKLFEDLISRNSKLLREKILQVQAFVKAQNTPTISIQQQTAELQESLSINTVLFNLTKEPPTSLSNCLNKILLEITNHYPSGKKCFFIYDLSNPYYIKQAAQLVYHLRLAGFIIYFDRGTNLSKQSIYYLKELEQVDFIIVFGTKSLLQKYQQPLSMEAPSFVQLELQSVATLVNKQNSNQKITTLLFEGDLVEALPSYLHPFKTIELFKYGNYIQGLLMLIRNLYNIAEQNILFDNFNIDIEHALSATERRDDKGHTRIAGTYDLLNKLNLEEVKELAEKEGVEVNITPDKNKANVQFGRGQFGKLRLARNIHTGQLLAVKKIKGDDKIAASQQEAFIQGQLLNKPFIMPLWNSIKTVGSNGEPVLYQFMPLAGFGDGETFQKKLASLSSLQLKEQLLTHVAFSLLSAVQHIHAVSIYHLDIKPSNFVITIRGQIYLTDFGCAIKQSSPQLMKAPGDMFYFSPERSKQIRHNMAFDATKADAWAIGLTLLEIFLNAYPFDRSLDLLKTYLTQEGKLYFQRKLAEIFMLQKAVPNSCMSIIKGLLEIEPNDRLTIDQALKELRVITPLFSSPDILHKIFVELKQQDDTPSHIEDIQAPYYKGYDTGEVQNEQSVVTENHVEDIKISYYKSYDRDEVKDKQAVFTDQNSIPKAETPIIVDNHSSLFKSVNQPNFHMFPAFSSRALQDKLRIFQSSLRPFFKYGLSYEWQTPCLIIQCNIQPDSKEACQNLLQEIEQRFNLIKNDFTISRIAYNEDSLALTILDKKLEQELVNYLQTIGFQLKSTDVNHLNMRSP
jgi:serine/threonine protein kinase